jgi:hypothetical protein
MGKFAVRFSNTKTKSMDKLQVEDQIVISSGLECTILEVYFFQGRKVYKTDRMGLVYADELEGR